MYKIVEHKKGNKVWYTIHKRTFLIWRYWSSHYEQFCISADFGPSQYDSLGVAKSILKNIKEGFYDEPKEIKTIIKL